MIEPELRRALEGSEDPEVRRRVNALLESIPHFETRPEHLRALRAVEVLEYFRTPEARQALVELAKGASQSRLTREAKAALGRWQQR
jgi:hypothetical protein